MGFAHKKITLRHLKAQGQVEGFHKLMNTTAGLIRAEGIDFQEAIFDMLQGTAPYE